MTDLFRLTDNAISPRKSDFVRAKARLPQAHQHAVRAAGAHLHRRVLEAAEDAGLDTNVIGLYRDNHDLFVGIQPGEAGRAVADHEFGTPDDMPQATLRKAARRAGPEVRAIYGSMVRNEIGI